MPRYRKKPVVIEAYQTKERVIIDTLEGSMTASPKDWIITGVKGERYPCKPDIFEATYEPESTPHPTPSAPVPVVSEGDIRDCFDGPLKNLSGIGTYDKTIANITALLHRAGGRVVTAKLLRKSMKEKFFAHAVWYDRDSDEYRLKDECINDLADAILTAIGGSLRPRDAAEGKGE